MGIPDISAAGFSQKYLDQIARPSTKDLKSFDNMDDALKFANEQHSGDEAIVKAKDGDKDVYVVVAIKTGDKAQNVFDPQQVNFRNALITRSDNRIEIVSSQSGTDINDDLKTANSLFGVTQKNQVKGFSQSKAYNQELDKGPAFQANLVTVLDKIDKTQTKVEAKKSSLVSELSALKSTVPNDQSAIAAKEKEISGIDIKLEEMKTAKGIMRSKLLIMPQTKGAGEDGKGNAIPGTTPKMHVGDLRNNTKKALEGIDARIAELQTKVMTEQNPDKISSLKTQISALQKQSVEISTTTLQIRQADLSMKMRIGSIATINNEISTAQTSISGKTKELIDLQAKLNAEPRKEIRDGIEAKMVQIKDQVNKNRTDLIKSMEKEIAVFQANAPRINGHLQTGAKAAVDLLNVQVAKLKALEGKSPEEIDTTVKQVQTQFKEELLKGKVEQAAKYWNGISPQEGEMIKDVANNTAKYIGDYKSAQTELNTLKSNIDDAKKLPDFKYSEVSFQDLMPAQGWKPGATGMTGVDANKKINETYSALDQEFTKYVLGGTNGIDANGMKNPVSNWMTYGKFASREAGSQIQNLEGAMEALETLKKFDGNSQNDRRAAQALIKIMDTGPMTKQAIRMSATSMGISGADKMGNAELVGNIMSKMGIPEAALEFLNPTNPIKIKTATAIASSAVLINGVINDLSTLHGALVKGNTEIYANIVPAYEVFLKAESQGKNGVEALKAAGFNGPTGGTFISDKAKDPQGFIVKAFSEYRNARNFEDKAKIAPNEAKYLRQQRDQAMHKANLLIGCQEQMAILQKPEVFGNPKVASMLKAMAGTMSIQDLPLPSGQFRENHLLTPNTATKDENWADFGTRMGLTDVTSQVKTPKDAERLKAIKIIGADAKPHYYVLPNDNGGIPKGPNGTISQYFADNLTRSDMITTPPRDIQSLYTDLKDGQVGLSDVIVDALPGTTVVPIVAESAVRVGINLTKPVAGEPPMILTPGATTVYRVAVNSYKALFE